MALRRLRLPARMYGGGIRSVVDIAPAAFVGALCSSAPLLIDRTDENWNVKVGFLSQLSAVFGPGAFDDTDSSVWFGAFVASGFSLGNALVHVWDTLQAEVGEVVDGPLASPVARAGAGFTKMQRLLTEEREKVRFQNLDVAFRSLPVDDMRRNAWMNLDRFSTVWVSAWPTKESYLSNPEFAEVASVYFGMPSPCCRQSVGEPIGNTRSTLDVFGMRLAAATLPGDGWRTQHDAIKWQIEQDAREMGIRHRTEVYGLFSACMPQQSRRAAAEMLPPRKRQGVVPDFLFNIALDGPERELLFELKTLHFGSSTYPESQQRCAAVARRARGLPAEYAAKARRVDQQFCSTARGAVGPVEAKLRTFDPVRGIVFGTWGEASPEVERLVHIFSSSGAAKHWRSMHAASPAEAKGGLAWLLRRRWAMTALRENARLKLERLQFVGRGAMAAAHRRAAPQAASGVAARRAACTFWQGPRLFGDAHADV